jgi:hypothetical protein
MKATATLAILVASCTAVLAQDAAPLPLHTVPKNLARQHYASNLLVFDAATQRYVATEAAAAWLDDDVATGWPTMAGKQHYLLQLHHPQLLTNFALSARDSQGTISLFTGDQPAAPGDVSWTAIARDVAVAEVNQKKLGTPMNATAQYLLIETNISEPGPIYSLYVYGDKPAATESIVKREQPVDVRTVAGEFVNNQTSFNLTSIYAKGLVSHASADGGAGTWQRAIDDNPESFVRVRPTTTTAGFVAKMDSTHSVSRLSVLADAGARGKVDVFLLDAAPAGNEATDLDGLTPAATLTFDGTTSRASADIDETPAQAVALRWTSAEGSNELPLRELNTFGELSLADYEVAGLSSEVASSNPAGAGDGKELMPIGEGKETVDFKGGTGKEQVPPIASGPAGRGFRPGTLGFPPNLSRPVSP